MATRRSLLPREHGAYAQLGVPLAAALALRPPTMSATLLALAASLAFLANEPLLVIRGHRGRRMLDEHGARAARRLAVLVVGAAIAAGLGLALADPRQLVIAAVAAVPAAGMLILAWIRAEHSWQGELLAAIALPAAAVPVATISGFAWQDATLISLAWSIGYACSVVAVHRVIARHRRAATWRDRFAAIALATTTLAAVIVAFALPLTIAAVPLTALSAILVIRPPSAARLRAIGVALVIASVIAGALTVAAAT